MSCLKGFNLHFEPEIECGMTHIQGNFRVHLRVVDFDSGLVIGFDKTSEIVWHFQGRLYDKIGLLCDKLCNFFSAN